MDLRQTLTDYFLHSVAAAGAEALLPARLPPGQPTGRTIVLRAGVPVTLQFVNRAGKGHDFTAEKFFRSSRILAGQVGAGEVELRPGQVANVTLVPAAGRYNVHCSHPFHKILGMHTTILVQ